MATAQLLRYQEEESQLLSQMVRVEGRATDLRSKINLLREEEQAYQTNIVEPALKALQLQQELARLQHEDEKIARQLTVLQNHISKSARDSIIKKYGDGTLRVGLELQFDDEPGKITLELSEETPHAVWVWLQQIE